MAVQPGQHRFGPEEGRIVLLTARDGMVAKVGHDLTIEVGFWSAELEVADDHSPARLTVRADMNSLVVREGSGGVMPLTDRDRREIAVTARKVLRNDRYPEAAFSASDFDAGPGGDGVNGAVNGTLTLAGASRPLRLTVSETGPGIYHATASVRQSDFGIKPYTAFLGTLKVSDAVRIVVDVTLPGMAVDSGTGTGA